MAVIIVRHGIVGGIHRNYATPAVQERMPLLITLFEFQKKKQEECYDKKEKPVIRSRTFHDEQVAGFMNLQTGEFTEVMLIHNSKDMDKFKSDSIGRILVIEFNEKDSSAFDEVTEVLKRYPDFKTML